MGLSDKINEKKADGNVIPKDIEVVVNVEINDEAKREEKSEVTDEIKAEDEASKEAAKIKKTMDLSAEKAEKLKNQMSATGKGATLKIVPNSTAAKLHAHLNMVGEDGLTHKDRIELELKEQAKKVKKIIYSVCGIILLLVLLGVAISSCSKSEKSPRNTTSSKRFSIKPQAYKTADEALVASTSFVHTMLSQKEKLYTVEKFNKVFDDLISVFPNDKAKIDAEREKMKKMYLL